MHAIRRDDGTGGQSTADIEEALSFLDVAFNPLNIFFVWDCNINDIDDTDLYEENDPAPADLWGNANYHHTDGIDIYLFPNHPEPGANGNGRATSEDETQTGFYVLGNYYEEPYLPRLKSHVMSHEMGHVLGLLHTHEEEIDDCSGSYEDCETSGDCICDTGCEIILAGLVDYDIVLDLCEYDGSITTCDSKPYTPDIGNIMSWTHDNCYVGFTQGQGQRMRNYISLQSKIQDCRLSQVIDSDETWNLGSFPSGEVILDGNLIVEADSKLTITSDITVRFPAGSNLIIKPDGEVFLSGKLTSTVCTGSCINNCDGTWKGVQVWGDNSTHQFEVNGVRAQGAFHALSGAVIENADVGVQLWGPAVEGEVNPPSGGLISAHEATFLNNRKAVDFKRYENYLPSDPDQPAPYLGSLSLCDFSVDDDYPHEDPFSVFVEMDNVDRVQIKACSFENVQNPSTASSVQGFGYGYQSQKCWFYLKRVV